jgi:hypothetical protein
MLKKTLDCDCDLSKDVCFNREDVVNIGSHREGVGMNGRLS